MPFFPIPVRTQEPMRVSPDVPNTAYEQKRITVNNTQGTLTYGAIAYVGPPTGYYWVVDSLQVELNANVDVGNRHLFIYFRDKDNRAMRHQILAGVAATNIKHICAPGVGCGSYTESERVSSSPLYTGVVDHPCAYGVLWNNFQGATDIVSMHVLVREYKVV